MAEVDVTVMQQVGGSNVLGLGATGGAGQTQRTLLPLHIKPGTPPFLRQHKRYDYIQEYVQFEKDRYKNTVKALFCFAFGILTLNVFAPGALLMIAMAARYQDLAWWDGFVSKTFGKYRSIVLVD